MTFLRALVVTCLVAAVPTTALAGAIDQGHCKMKDMPAQESAAHMDHSMHAGHMMGGASADHSAHVKASKAANDCTCGCNCSNNHCASSFSGFLNADLGGNLASMLVDSHPLPSLTVRVSAAHHLDLIRPPARA